MKVTDIMNELVICRIFNPNTKYVFSVPHASLSNPDHIVKANLKRYKRIEIMPCVLSDHHGLELDSTTAYAQHKAHTLIEVKQLSIHRSLGQERNKEIKTF